MRGAMRPRRAAALRALLLLLACALRGSAAAQQRGGAAAGEGDALRGAAVEPRAFFALGDNPLAWDDDVLSRATDVRATPRARGAAEAQLFRAAGNVAAHLGLRPVEGLHLPTPVNVLLVGFAGDGHRNVTLSAHELGRWVEHMDAVLPHARLPGTPLPPVGGADGAGSGAAAATSGATKTDAEAEEAEEAEAPLFWGESYVSYNMSVHALEAGPAVTAVFERAVAVLARPLDPRGAEAELAAHAAATSAGGPAFAPGVWYHVDAAAMGALLESLLAELGIEGDAYNIALLNPRRAALPAHYGYRTGFSAPELQLLAEQWESHGMEAAARAAARGAPHPSLTALLRAAPPASPAARRWRAWSLPGEARAKFAFKSGGGGATEAWAARAMAALEEVASFRAGLTPSAVLRAEAAAVLAGGDAGAARALRAALARPGRSGSRAAAHADCLADGHVARGRAAFLDLSAGPLGVGPAGGGGAGLRRGSLVDAVFPPGAAGDAAAAAAPPDEEALHAALDELSATHMRAGSDDEADDAQLLEAELDVYEAFAALHCARAPAGRAPPLCAQLAERTAALVAELEAISREVATSDSRATPKPRPHRWNIFEGDPAVGGATSLARDRFLTEVVVLLSSALRHVAAPRVHPGAFRYHDTVRIALYDVLLREPGRPGGGSATQQQQQQQPRFNAAAFRDAAAALLLPGQALQFTVTLLDAGDDAALGGGIAASLRSAAAPEALPRSAGGGVAPVTHRYLDAHELRRQLAEAAAAQTTTQAQIPVFIITAEGGPPLYIDPGTRSVATSLPELVLAVASPHVEQPGPVACSEGPLLRDLSDPLAPALAALAAHLGGAAPLHAGGAPRGSADDYAWSAGAHPLAATSSAHGAGAAQVVADVIHRSYVVTALDASIADANAGIAALGAVRSSDAAWRTYRRAHGPAASVVEAWAALVAAWHGAADAAAALDYGGAAAAGRTAERAGVRFRSAADVLAAALRPARCAPRAAPRATRLPWQTLLIGAMALAAAAAAVQLLRPRKHKAKLN